MKTETHNVDDPDTHQGQEGSLVHEKLKRFEKQKPKQTGILHFRGESSV